MLNKCFTQNRSRQAGGYLVAFLLGLLIASCLLWLASKSGQRTLPATERSSVTRANEIQVTLINLERPDYLIARTTEIPPPPKWYFAKFNPEQLLRLFAAASLTPEQRVELSSTNEWSFLPDGGIVVQPPVLLVLGMSPVSRQRIYRVLATDARNEQSTPFMTHLTGLDNWLAETGLAPSEVRTFRHLLYTNSGSLCFADLSTFEGVHPGEATARLLKSVSRVPTLLLRVKINASTDLDAVQRNWGKFNQASIRPLLDSVARAKESSSLSLYHFLPPFARQLLYTYPDPRADPQAARRDCIWSAMNFYEPTPNDAFFDFEHTTKVIRTRFDQVAEAREFGDLIVLGNEAGEVVHMCVHIAEDIVFTKNGADIHQPWVLMRLSDVLAKYPASQPLRFTTFRPRNN